MSSRTAVSKLDAGSPSQSSGDSAWATEIRYEAFSTVMTYGIPARPLLTVTISKAVLTAPILALPFDLRASLAPKPDARVVHRLGFAWCLIASVSLLLSGFSGRFLPFIVLGCYRQSRIDTFTET